MRKALPLIAVGMLLLSTLACGGSKPQVILENDSSYTVCYVNISLTSSSDWGDDMLGANETIEPGESRTFDVDAGTYDLRALDCNQEVLDIQNGVEVDGPITWTLSDL